jgi:hypothetical protein
MTDPISRVSSSTRSGPFTSVFPSSSPGNFLPIAATIAPGGVFTFLPPVYRPSAVIMSAIATGLTRSVNDSPGFANVTSIDPSDSAMCFTRVVESKINTYLSSSMSLSLGWFTV